MKKFIIILLFFFIPTSIAFADTHVTVSNNGTGSNSDVSVNQQTSGQTTTCINGNCTTTGGGSHATVCINGKCTESDNGDIDAQSDDGHSQVHISNSGTNSSTSSTSSNNSKTSISVKSDTDSNSEEKEESTKSAEIKKKIQKAKSLFEMIRDFFKSFFGIPK